MLEWHRLQCAHVRTSCQTETRDGGKWVTLQDITVERNVMEKYIRMEEVIQRKDVLKEQDAGVKSSK